MTCLENGNAMRKPVSTCSQGAKVSWTGSCCDLLQGWLHCSSIDSQVYTPLRGAHRRFQVPIVKYFIMLNYV